MTPKAERLCGKCHHFYRLDNQPYHDCREGSPRVIVPSFKQGTGQQQNVDLGKIMTVWPRVSPDEKGCGKFLPIPEGEQC